jgi:hypothetical protein
LVDACKGPVAVAAEQVVGTPAELRGYRTKEIKEAGYSSMNLSQRCGGTSPGNRAGSSRVKPSTHARGILAACLMIVARSSRALSQVVCAVSDGKGGGSVCRISHLKNLKSIPAEWKF